MAVHTCEAVVVSCIDFRFQKYIREWLATHLADKTFDYVAFAGGTKELDIVLKQIDLSVALHAIKEIYLLHHEDCGAYGPQGTKERHFRDLQKAKEAILTKYPSLYIEAYFIHQDGTFEQLPSRVLA